MRNFLFLLTFIIVFSSLYAQVPSDLSKVTSSQISDAQLKEILNQAKSKGMSEGEMVSDLKKRGLPDSEIQQLITRSESMLPNGSSEEFKIKNEEKDGNKSLLIQVNPEAKSISRIFGADLFSSASNLFLPNLKIPTPINYVIGPDDELQLDIFGNNISSQKVKVSVDGYVNIKYLGPFNVSGKTIEDATQVLRSRLSKFYPALKTGGTKIQLTLSSIRSISVTIVGAVRQPGSLTLPSVSRLFNALYLSGGPSEKGSFRNIQLIRDNKILGVADLYEFLLKGDQTSNYFLRNNDVINIPITTTQVVIDGQVNRPGIFELNMDETVNNLIDYAGGFKSGSYKGRVVGTRYTKIEKRIIDIPDSLFTSFKMLDGDSIHVESVLDRFDNRVYITGAVYKPGSYSLEEGLDILGLIKKAEGLKEDAFLKRVNIIRLKDNREREYVSLELSSLIDGRVKFQLIKDDSVHVSSILELKEKPTVHVSGMIKNPGVYAFEDSMTLGALILQAGGFLEAALPEMIEVSRRNLNVNLVDKNSNSVKIFNFQLDRNLTKAGAEFMLLPFDQITVKSDPGKRKQKTVLVSGEVLYPGVYTLVGSNEKIGSILERVGGVLPSANIYGVKVLRKIDSSINHNLKLSLKLLNSSNLNDTLLNKNPVLESGQISIAVNLSAIQSDKNSKYNFKMNDGDQVVVSENSNTVKVLGHVLSANGVGYHKSNGLKYYITSTGGFSELANRKKVFITYENGVSSRTKHFFGLRIYPKVFPGATIYVPAKKEKSKLDPAQTGVFISGISVITTALILLFR